MKIRLFSGRLLLPLAMFLLLAVSDLSSSSRAEDGFWLARSQSGLEQLWSGMLGCAESTDPFAARNRFDDFEDTNGGAPPTVASSDYSQCGKRALRNTSSRILVDTIEDVVRSGGVALFSEHFRFDSSVGWVLGENITGEIDAVIPVFSRERSNGAGQALFLQPGAVFWSGLESENRIDANLGLAYRRHLRPGVVAGGSIFYDYDLKREHQRVGLGADVQSGSLQAALNYYHPLNDWQEGRTDYEEQPLQGGDFRLGFVRSRIRLDTSIGVWRFEGEEEENAKWRPSFEIGAGYWIYPGVSLEGGYENHDSDSLDSRWNAGLVFRFSLPDFQGVKGYETAGQANLWEPVRREKRILYEEREAIPPVRLSPASAVDENGESVDPRLPLAQPAGDGSMTTVVIAGELEAALPTDVMFQLVVEDSTAEAGVDYNYGHRVYELDAATGEQTAPAGDAIDCGSAAMCEMPIPAGVTRFDIEVDILKDADPKERREDIVVRVDPPEEHQRMIRGGETRLTIEAHGNEIGFATDAVATLAENNERTGVEVQVSIDEPSPTPITLNVATSGTATVNEDYRINTTALRIPANASSASLTLRGINNDEGEGSKSIVLTLSGNLPEGWTITDDEHTVTLQDDDLSIFFTGATTSSVDEPGTGSNADVTVAVGITQAPTANITVRVAAGGTGETATPGSSMDYTFTGMDFTFPADSTALQTATFSVHPDNVAEEDEFIILTLADDTTTNSSREREGSGFSLGNPHTITIPANDNTVGFASGAVDTLGEDGGTANVDVSISNPAPVDITLNVSVDMATSTATEGTDFTLSPSTLTISRGDTTGTITLTGIDDRLSEGNKDIDLTLSVVGNLPDGWAEGDLEHKVTLQDDDLSIGFAKGSETIDEPASNTDHRIDIEITEAPTAAITLQISKASSSTADTTGSDIDVTFSPTTVTFMPGPSAATEHTVTLNVKADTVAEGAEFIELELGDSGNTRTSGGNAFSFGRQKYRLNINASDNTVGFASGAVDTLGEDGGTANVDVSISNPAPVDITLNVSVDRATSTATEGTDFTLSPSTLTISRGDTTGTITLTGIDDRLSEGNKDIDLTLSVVGNLPDGWAEGDLEHKVTLQDDDLSIGFAKGSETIDEPASNTDHRIDIEITEAPTAAITLQISKASSSTADTTGSDIDVTFSPTTVTFMPGPSAATEHTVTLNVKADTVAEGAEFIELELGDSGNTRTSGGNAFSFGRQKYRLNINANDNTVSFASGTSTLTEGASTMTEVMVNVDKPAPENIALDVAVLPASTATEGTDYTIDSKSLMISAGQSSGTITLRGRDDSDGEGDETVMLEIMVPGGSSLPSGWALGAQTTHTVTIEDNDPSIHFVTSGENATPSRLDEPSVNTMFMVTIGITRAPTADITVTVSSGGSGETATSGVDFAIFSPNDTVTFTRDGALEQTIEIILAPDREAEPDEFIVLMLGDDAAGSRTSEGSNFLLGVEHTITISANGNTVGFASGTSTLTEGSSTMTEVMVNVDKPASEDIVLDVAVTGTTDLKAATEGTDYTIDSKSLTIRAGQSSGTVTLRGRDDSAVEGNETIMLEIRESSESPLPSGWTISGQTTHTVTLYDNDLPTVSLRADSTSITEGNAETITLTLSESLGSEAKFNLLQGGEATYGTSDDWNLSVDGTDCDMASQTNPCQVTISSGSTTAEVTVKANTDANIESPSETFSVSVQVDAESRGIVMPGSPSSLSFTIEDPPPTISFSGGHGSDPTKVIDAIDEGVSGSATLTITISPAPASQISIPLTTTGSHAAYGDSLAVSGGTLTGKPSTNDVMLSVPANTGTVTLTITAAQDGADGKNDITISLGTPLPGNYMAGTASTWEIAIHDDD